ncbi:type II/IV secretion system protein, partial [Acinetobacter nosocomialis]|nr:type II/IV secretion system protein [Acinetobacter nosocomialis]
MNAHVEIDAHWCLEQLLQEGRITERDKLLVQTTNRQKDQLKWHPLQWIAHFNLKDQQHVQAHLSLNRLCQWFADMPYTILFG